MRPHRPSDTTQPDRAARPGLPPGFRLRLDPSTRRVDGGTVVVGGAPLRLLRLSPSGSAWLDRLAGGHPVPDDPAVGLLARRLVDCGAAHPQAPPPQTGPDGTGPVPPVTVVVPVRDDADGVGRLLSSLVAGGGSPSGAPHAAAPAADRLRVAPQAVVVVDDGSADPAALQAAVRQAAGGGPGPGPVTVLRTAGSRGPAAARNLGAAVAGTDLVAFVDADVTVPDGWLGPLVAHFADPVVAAVAPRVTAPPPGPPGSGALDGRLSAFDAVRSPLDLGGEPSPVRPGARVPFVPSAVLVVRRRALVAVGGFDPDLRTGEDVDLVWRLAREGWTVRYEPAVRVTHRVRPDLAGWLAQRFGYGTSAAPLARRHPGALAPVRVSRWSAAAWLAAALGFPAAGAAVAGTTTAALVPRLEGLRHPVAEAVRLAGRGHLAAGAALAEAARRPLWPAALLAAARWPRARPAVAVALVAAPLWRWARARPAGTGPAAWLALHLADDLAYGAGVWAGCLRWRTAAPLVPDLSDWPGGAPARQRVSGPPDQGTA